MKEGLSTEETTGRAWVGLLWLTGESEKRGLADGFREGISGGRAATAHCSPGCKSCGDSEFKKCMLEREESHGHAPSREKMPESLF